MNWPVHLYLQAYQVALFLSANEQDVASAIHVGIASATMISPPSLLLPDNKPQLRIAFDADCVLFSDGPI